MRVTTPRLRRLIAVALGFALLTACSQDVTWRESALPSPTASPTPTGPQEITLAFAGDVHFAGRTLSLLDNPATAFGPVGGGVQGGRPGHGQP